MSETLIAVIIGIVEGLTEFLPVSSTGHMILVGHLIGYEGKAAAVFEVFIQLGAILAVVFFYKERFLHFLTADGWKVNRGFSGWHVGAAIVPVMLIGYILHKPIKTYLFSPFTVIVGLIIGGIVMLVAEKYAKNKRNMLTDISDMSLIQSALVGIFQVLALWPGFSRSGSTLSGGLLIGISRKASADFSFIIAVPLMFVACIYDLIKNLKYLDSGDLYMLSVGFVVAGVVAYFSIMWFLKFLNKSSLASFAYYRFVLAIVSYWYFFVGK